jgi:hypothetical protein
MDTADVYKRFASAGTLLLANLVAAIPGRNAARTPTALVLSAE